MYRSLCRPKHHLHESRTGNVAVMTDHLQRLLLMMMMMMT
jgi:hypothetical protein